MEDKTEKESQLPERKDPNDEEGGIRRRLRDRDLLRKRKAEAEEKATNQWVYGAQSRRKRERREERSGTGKKGRPRKTNPPLESPVSQEEIPLVDVAPVPVVEIEPLFTIQAIPPEPQPVSAATALPVPVPSANPLPDPVPVLAPGPAPILAAVPAPAPAPAPALPSASAPAFPAAVTATSGSAEEVLIEDLGPDEEEDLPLPQGNLIIDQGPSEEPPADVPEQRKPFSYPLFASAPPQQEYFPGNFI